MSLSFRTTYSSFISFISFMKWGGHAPNKWRAIGVLLACYSYQPVSVDPLAFVQPQMHKFFCDLELIWLSYKQPLEHVAEMSDIELVVKVRRSLPEIGSDLNKTGHSAQGNYV